MTAKKELLITLEFPPDVGGVSTYLSGLFRGFPAGSLLIMAPPGGKTDYPHRVLRPPFYFKKIWPQWLLALIQAFKICRRENIGRVYISHVLPIGYIAYILKIILKKDYVVFLHGLDARLAAAGKWKKFWFKKIIQSAQMTVANSAYTKNEILEIIKPGRRQINIVEPSPKTFKDIGENRDKPIIFSVARLVPRKGIDLAIAAMPQILAEIPEAKYYIAGSGPEQMRLRNQINSLGLDDSVHLLGAIPDATLSEFYGKSSVFLFPARELGADVEGFGIAPLEASAHGIPVVAGRSGGVSEAVAHGETGILIPPGNIEAIYETVVFLLKNRELARKLGEAGRKRAELFRPELQTKKLFSYLEYAPHITHQNILKNN